MHICGRVSRKSSRPLGGRQRISRESPPGPQDLVKKVSKERGSPIRGQSPYLKPSQKDRASNLARDTRAGAGVFRVRFDGFCGAWLTDSGGGGSRRGVGPPSRQARGTVCVRVLFHRQNPACAHVCVCVRACPHVCVCQCLRMSLDALRAFT